MTGSLAKKNAMRAVSHTRHLADVVAALMLVAVTAGAYWRVLGCGFINYDDPLYVTTNPHVLTGLTFENLKWAFNVGYAGNWHPLTWMSHMLDTELFGASAIGRHAVSLILHIANTLLLFRILERATRSVWKSAFVAALFAVHPLRVESVAWIAERKDVLSGVFWMLTMWAYVRFTERVGTGRYLVVLCSFALGLMSKPMLVTLPIVLMLMDYWPLERMKTKQTWMLLREKLPLLVMSAASCLITYFAQSSGRAVVGVSQFPLGERIANALVAYVGYIAKMIVPAKLAIFYPFHGGVPGWQVVGSAVLLLLITMVVVRFRERRRLLVGWLWYVITLVPVIGIVQVGDQAMADRYTYIPLIGLFLIVSEGTGEWGRGRAGRWPAAVSVVIVVALSVMTARQVAYWRNSETLFRHALAVTRDNYTAEYGLGTDLLERGETDEAEAHLRDAVRLAPADSRAHYNLGLALSLQGRLDEAISEFRAALEIAPDYADAHNNLGVCLEERGDLSGALSHYRRATEIAPDSDQARYNLGVALAKKGRLDEAIEALRAALEINPNNEEARRDLDRVLSVKTRE